MKKIGDMLGDAVGRGEIVRQGKAQRILRRWDEVVGAEMARRSSPDRYGQGTVWVAVQSAAWAQELRMAKDLILERLNGLSDEPNMFKDVRFGVRPFVPFQPATIETSLAVVEVEDPRRQMTIREIMRLRLGDAADAETD